MLLKLYRSMMPRDTTFVVQFHRHAAIVAQAAVQFRALMEPGADKRACYNQISHLEHNADSVAGDLERAVSNTYLPPFDHGDVLLLVNATDDIVDRMKKAARSFLRYGVEFTPTMCSMADTIVAATVALETAMPLLDDINAKTLELKGIYLPGRASIVHAYNHRLTGGRGCRTSYVGRALDCGPPHRGSLGHYPAGLGHGGCAMLLAGPGCLPHGPLGERYGP